MTHSNKNLEEIRISALRGGACRKVMRIHDFPELIKLMFTPQGIEFCQDHNFPSVEPRQFRRAGSICRCGQYRAQR